MGPEPPAQRFSKPVKLGITAAVAAGAITLAAILAVTLSTESDPEPGTSAQPVDQPPAEAPPATTTIEPAPTAPTEPTAPPEEPTEPEPTASATSDETPEPVTTVEPHPVCHDQTVVDQSLTQLVADCKALWAFYTTLDDKGALGNDPTSVGSSIGVDPAELWSDTNPLRAWYGVTIANGRVTRLDLSDTGLTGTIPSELGNLSNLQLLNLSNGYGGVPNVLSGPIPPELGNLTNLHTLLLGRNYLSDEIPPELGNLTNLKILSIESNDLVGPIPQELGNLADLEELFLAGNRLTGSIPPDLDNLIRLSQPHPSVISQPCASETVVDQSLTQLVEDCEALWAFYLDLDGNGLYYRDDPSIHTFFSNVDPTAAWNETNPIENWHGVTITDDRVTHLELRLVFDGGRIAPEIGSLTELKVLDLAGNGLYGSIPPELGNLQNLQTLNLESVYDCCYNYLSGSIPPEIGNLANLRELHLWSNELSGFIPSELGNLANLQLLDLDQNIDLSGPIPPELGNLASLQRLYLGQTSLSGSIPPELGRLTNLHTMIIGENDMNGKIPAELGNLIDLAYLALSDDFSGPIPPDIANLTNLRILDLQGNFSGSIPPEFANLTNLERLCIGHGLSGMFPNWLSNLTNLQVLSLWTNNFTGPTPPKLADLAPGIIADQDGQGAVVGSLACWWT